MHHIAGLVTNADRDKDLVITIERCLGVLALDPGVTAFEDGLSWSVKFRWVLGVGWLSNCKGFEILSGRPVNCVVVILPTNAGTSSRLRAVYFVLRWLSLTGTHRRAGGRDVTP